MRSLFFHKLEGAQILEEWAILVHKDNIFHPFHFYKGTRSKNGLKSRHLVAIFFSGWITQELFAEWLQHFVQNLLIYSRVTYSLWLCFIIDNYYFHSTDFI